MQIIKINKDSQRVEFDVQVDPAVWTDELAKTRKALAKNVKVEGFRPGHVPADIANKYVSEGDVLTRALDKIIEPTHKELEASNEFKSGNEDLIEVPTVNVLKIDPQELQLSFVYDLYPTVELGDYKGLSLPNNAHPTVTDDDVNNEINKYLRFQKKVVDKTDGTLQKGDIAVFDFEGFKDGVAFAGGNAKNFELEIGSNQFVPGFEDQMVGMKIGETRELNITFPADYAAKELAGAKTVFKVTLNGIKTQEVPALDEAFVEKQNIPNIKTVDEFKAYVKQQLQAQYDTNYKDVVNRDIVNDVVALAKISHVPASMVNTEKNRIKQMFESQMSQKGLNLEQYLKLVNMSDADFDAKLTEDATNSLKYALAIEKIAEQENIEVTDDDVNEYLGKVAKVYNLDVAELQKQLGPNVTALKDQLLSDKILDQLIAWNQKNPTKKDEEKHEHNCCGHCDHEQTAEKQEAQDAKNAEAEFVDNKKSCKK